MYRVFLADTNGENIRKLGGLLEEGHGVVPDIWRDIRGYHDFIGRPEDGIVLIRINDCTIPGLELTQAAVACGAGIHVVWMSESKTYALDAFRYGVEAYMLLPATGEALRNALNSLRFKGGTGFKQKEKM
ncbi:MAG: hypothetical protein VB120_01205 [Lachnospiraceae bacterium]|nr:hypothetical protein [Lachnospiraceae bacterium]